MDESIQVIPIANLLVAFAPVVVVVGLLWHWSLNHANALYAVARMLGQLLLVGYVLVFIFDTRSSGLVLGVLAVMLVASSWIALGSIRERRRALYPKALASIAFGGGAVLLLVTQGVLDLDPWYEPRYVVPLAGMIFANAMNAVSLAAERMYAELDRHVAYPQARNAALGAALIPTINSCFAVGLVALPGMMTGQILAGVSPLIASRYQIMVMCMVFGAAGIASAAFLAWTRPRDA